MLVFSNQLPPRLPNASGMVDVRLVLGKKLRADNQPILEHCQSRCQSDQTAKHSKVYSQPPEKICVCVRLYPCPLSCPALHPHPEPSFHLHPDLREVVVPDHGLRSSVLWPATPIRNRALRRLLKTPEKTWLCHGLLFLSRIL